MTPSKHFFQIEYFCCVLFIHWLNLLSTTYVNSEVAQLKEEHKKQIEEYQNRKEEVETIITNSKRDINVSI